MLYLLLLAVCFAAIALERHAAVREMRRREAAEWEAALRKAEAQFHQRQKDEIGRRIQEKIHQRAAAERIEGMQNVEPLRPLDVATCQRLADWASPASLQCSSDVLPVQAPIDPDARYVERRLTMKAVDAKRLQDEIDRTP